MSVERGKLVDVYEPDANSLNWGSAVDREVSKR